MKYIYKIQKFMYGRYGPDELYKFLFKLYICLFLIGLFIRNYLFTIIELLILIIIFFRFFSKNIYARNRENQKFLNVKKTLSRPFINIKRNIQDKDHIYKKCHQCKRTLKLPLPFQRGIKITKCPHCGKRMRILAFKYQKVEIIRKKN